MKIKSIFFLLLSFHHYQAAEQGHCSPPANPPYGEWICFSPSLSSMSCTLTCDPGWVVQGKSTVKCDDGKWLQPGINFGCTAVESVMIAGNYDLDNFENMRKVELYGKYHGNDLTEEQRILPDITEQRSDSTLDYVNSQVLICGGWGSRRDTCSFFIPGQGSSSWNSSYYNMLARREDHKSVVLGGKLYLLGGDNTPLTTEYIEPCTSTTAKQGIPLVSKSSGACAVAITHDTFALIGGSDFSCGSYSGCGSRSGMVYNITSGTHYSLPEMKYARMNHDCVMFKDPKTREKFILVTGGRFEGKNYVGNTEILKVGGSFWWEKGQLNRPRSNLRLAVMEKQIFAFGGYAANQDKGSDNVEEFDIETGTWNMTRSMMYRRAGHGVSAVPSDINNSC